MIEYIEEHETITVKLPSQVDTYACEKFRDELLEKTGSASGKIVFDMAEVGFVSSEFLKICCIVHKSVGSDNFTLHRLNPMVYKVFRTAGLTELLKIS